MVYHYAGLRLQRTALVALTEDPDSHRPQVLARVQVLTLSDVSSQKTKADTPASAEPPNVSGITSWCRKTADVL